MSKIRCPVPFTNKYHAQPVSFTSLLATATHLDQLQQHPTVHPYYTFRRTWTPRVRGVCFPAASVSLRVFKLSLVDCCTTVFFPRKLCFYSTSGGARSLAGEKRGNTDFRWAGEKRGNTDFNGAYRTQEHYVWPCIMVLAGQQKVGYTKWQMYQINNFLEHFRHYNWY